MFFKFLITVSVVALAVLYARKRSSPARHISRQAGDRAPGGTRAADSNVDDFLHKAGKTPLRHRRRWLWLALPVLLACAGFLYSYTHWLEQNRELTVLLYNGDSDSPAVYRVIRKDLKERSFISRDGTHVSLSSTERMEVIGL